MAILLAVVNTVVLKAAHYSARPALAQVVLGGRTLLWEVELSEEVGGETARRALALLPGEFPR